MSPGQILELAKMMHISGTLLEEVPVPHRCKLATQSSWEKAEKARRLVIYRNRGDWPSEAVLSHQEGGCLSGELMAGWR